VRFTTDAEKLKIIATVAEMGFIDQILVAQDVCQPWQYVRKGGKGFAHHLENLIPRMRKMGFTEADLHKIFVENPARALAFE
jgi:phosphotriesterase-related protein